MKRVVGLGFGLTLVLLIGHASAQKPAPAPVLRARTDVLEVVKLVESGSDAITIDARILRLRAANADLLDVMTVFKTSEKHGLGYGEDAKKGIESAILELQRGNTPIAARLKKEQADLLKVAYVSIAMADIIKPYFPGNTRGNGRQDWNRWSEEQKVSAQNLLKAIKASDAKGAKSAMRKLRDACVVCHGDFKK